MQEGFGYTSINKDRMGHFNYVPVFTFSDTILLLSMTGKFSKVNIISNQQQQQQQKHLV